MYVDPALSPPAPHPPLPGSVRVYREHGVKLYIDTASEDYFIDAALDHAHESWLRALNLIDELGLDLIPEDECEPDVLENGTIRFYLYEVNPA